MKTSCCRSEKFRVENSGIICLNQECSNYTQPATLSNLFIDWNNTFLFSFLIFFFLFSFDNFSLPESPQERNFMVKRIQADNQLPLTLENLRFELDRQHIICPEQVFAQIMIESGHMKSFLYNRTNNLIGMRYPGKRESNAIGIFLADQNLIVKGSKKELQKYCNQNQYAVYACWQDCIRDYKIWQDQCFRLTDRYLEFIGRYYSADASYVKKIKSMVR